MALSPNVLVQDGSGPFVGTTNGVNVTAGNTISIKLVDVTDVTAWFLQITGTDELILSNPTLTGVNPTTNQVATPGTVVTFDYPAGAGHAITFKSTVNGSGGPLTSLIGVYVLTLSGQRVGAVGETREANPIYGWAATVNPALRGGGLPPLSGVQFSVLIEDPGGSLVFERLTEDMILPGFSAGFSKSGPTGQTLFRRGDTVTGITGAASYVSGPPTGAHVTNSFGGSSASGDIDPGVWALPGPSFASATLAGSIKRIGTDGGSDPYMSATLTATKGITRTSGFTMVWTSDVWFGTGVAGFSTETDIKTLAGTTLAQSRGRTITVGPSNQKVYYAYPQQYGTATFTLNGFPAAFLTPSVVSVTNVNGVVRSYYLYESTNLLTGTNLNFVVA